MCPHLYIHIYIYLLSAPNRLNTIYCKSIFGYLLSRLYNSFKINLHACYLKALTLSVINAFILFKKYLDRTCFKKLPFSYGDLYYRFVHMNLKSRNVTPRPLWTFLGCYHHYFFVITGKYILCTVVLIKRKLKYEKPDLLTWTCYLLIFPWLNL